MRFFSIATALVQACKPKQYWIYWLYHHIIPCYHVVSKHLAWIGTHPTNCLEFLALLACLRISWPSHTWTLFVCHDLINWIWIFMFSMLVGWHVHLTLLQYSFVAQACCMLQPASWQMSPPKTAFHATTMDESLCCMLIKCYMQPNK